MRPPRVFMINRSLASHLARGVHVGGQFVFIDLDAVDQHKVDLPSSLHPMQSDSGSLGSEKRIDREWRRLTIPIPPGEKLSLPGVNVKASRPPSLWLKSLTCDRDLYLQGSDQINVLLVDLDSADRDVRVNLLLGDSRSSSIEFDQRHVQLNQCGMAIVRFDDLPIGNYRVVRADYSDGFSECEFRVAGFELAPLVATIGQMQLRNSSLSCVLRLFHFAKPLTGAIRVDLYDGSSRIDSRRISVKQGLAIVGLEIEGEGPHHLEITMMDDASATASIPLPGSERQQREETILTACGLISAASLMPGPDTTEALGLHVRQTEQDNSPVQITDSLNGLVRIEAIQDIEDCVACTTALASPNESSKTPPENYGVQRFGNLSAGEVVEIQSSDLTGLISVGCFVDGTPWEARAVTLRRCDWQASLRVDVAAIDGPLIPGPVGLDASSESSEDDHFEPGEKVSVSVDLGTDVSAHAAVVIRDSRLQPSSRPKQKLAAQIKAAADEAQPGEVEMQPVYGSTRQYENHPHWWHFSPSSPPIDNETLAKLVQRDLISDEQADHIMESASECGKPYYTLIVDNGYAEAEDLSRTLAAIYGYDFVDVDSLSINDSILELCPESVARENSVMPIREGRGGILVFAMSNPLDLEIIEKLRFILNRRIEVMIGTPDAIMEAINHFYGQIEGEYADSMLQEFTDLAIDFTETIDAACGDDIPIPLATGEINGGSSGEIECTDDAHVIFCELIECSHGRGSAVVELPDRVGRYTVDAFVVAGRQWAQTEFDIEVHSDPYVKLQLPDLLLQGDQASGRVVARCESRKFSLEVLCDGVPIALHCPNPPYHPITTHELSVTETEFGFSARLGQYTARVCDRVSGKTREDRHTIGPLGELIVPRRTLRMLSGGEIVELNDEIRRIRLLPSVQPIKQMVAESTAHYDHLCCEQTAAKLFSAVICLANQIGSGEPTQKTLTAIRVGMKRQRGMWLPGKGFASYPNRSPDDTWGRMATKHLLKMDFVGEVFDSNGTAQTLINEIRVLAREAATQYQISWPPPTIETSEDAYAQLRFGRGNSPEALDYARRQARKPLGGIRSFWRAEQAMAAATMLRGGKPADTAEAMQLANRLFDELGPKGRLYSTVDSVALVVLLLELSRAQWIASNSIVQLNNKSMSIADALANTQRIQSLKSDNEFLAVECLCYAKENWIEFVSNTPISVSLIEGGRLGKHFSEGAAIDLRVRVKKGYEAGDLVWVALPPCLSRIEGGGQVKQFAVDLQGKPETTIRLAATAPSSHPSHPPANQHFLVCLRNMYDEDRIGNPGPIPIQVTG